MKGKTKPQKNEKIKNDTIEGIGKIVAITWTPRPSSSNVAVDPLNTYLYHIVTYLSEIRHCSKKFLVYPEFNKKQHLHYHGIIWIHDIISFHRKVIPKLQSKGFVLVKNNPDEGWRNYIKKDYEEMETILSPAPVPLVYQDLFVKGNTRYSSKKFLSHHLEEENKNYESLISTWFQPTS